MTKLIKRTYRITEDNEKAVKKHARKKYISESEVIRKAIENLTKSISTGGM